MSDTIGAQRWIIKKTARALTCAITCPACMMQAAINKDPKIRVLTYHGFGDNLRAPFSVSQQEFERQVKWLKTNDLLITPNQFRKVLSGAQKFTGTKILITIDDGQASVASIALDVLKHYDASAILFAIPNYVGLSDYMDEKQLINLVDNNIEIGSHSLSHQSMGRIPLDAARDEIHHSREILQDMIGGPVTSFAYPYGTLNDFNADTRDLIKNAGYDLAFTSQHGAVQPLSDPLEIQRVKVEGGDPAWHFPLLCQGGMDAWRIVDRLGSALQKPSIYSSPATES